MLTNSQIFQIFIHVLHWFEMLQLKESLEF